MNDLIEMEPLFNIEKLNDTIYVKAITQILKNDKILTHVIPHEKVLNFVLY